ncbi:MAG: hypothetical protein IPK16_29130 [Anaerolineales bacterium]|nr:hypothetical protein [Anaerolineales bacterium]
MVRPRLIKEIEQGLNRSLTLISAPAGYGKTMLASSFLENCGLPNAWLALDENDNDLGLYLRYLTLPLSAPFRSRCAAHSHFWPAPICLRLR